MYLSINNNVDNYYVLRSGSTSVVQHFHPTVIPAVCALLFSFTHPIVETLEVVLQ